MQSFNRIEDPVIDQDNAKLLGAAAGGVGAWKHHSQAIAKRKGLIDRALGRAGSLVTRPARALVGAGLGALAAGTLARYINKENKEDHEKEMAEARAQQVNMYPQYGMQRYASYNQEDVKTDKLINNGIRGGLIGALASAMLGGNVVRGAGTGALANSLYNLYKDQQHTNNQTQDKFMYDADRMERYAMEKDAGLASLANKMFMRGIKKGGKLMSSAGKAGAKGSAAAAAGVKSNAAALRREFLHNAPGVNPLTGMSLKKA